MVLQASYHKMHLKRALVDQQHIIFLVKNGYISVQIDPNKLLTYQKNSHTTELCPRQKS